MTEQVRRSESDGVLTLTFTRDAKLNAVSPEMLEAIRQAVCDLGDCDDLRVLVLAAEGRYFTAGIDILQSGAGGRRGYAPDGSFSPRRLRRGYRTMHLLFDEIEAIEKPIVLAAHARCLGVGVELSASCDFRLASTQASFALPELPALAVIPGSGGISRVTRLVGPHWGKWLAFGEEISAEQALSIGLVHAVYPAEEFPARVDAFARKLAQLPSEAAGVAKAAVDVAASVDRQTARDFDRFSNTLLLMSDEHKERTRAFGERRSGGNSPRQDPGDGPAESAVLNAAKAPEDDHGTRPVRRVVTALGPDGRSRIASDGVPTRTAQWKADEPRAGYNVIWGQDSSANMADLAVDQTDHIDHVFPTGAGGTRFLIQRFDPDYGVKPAQALAMREGLSRAGLGIAMDRDGDAGFHATATIDYAIILSGRIQLVTDDDETVLRPGDTVVQTGVAHAWRNPFEEPCEIAFVLIGAARD